MRITKKDLLATIETMKEEKAKQDEMIQALKRYLALPKFRGMGNDYVNVNDILSRLQAY